MGIWTKIGLVAGGAAATLVAQAASKAPAVKNAAVRGTAAVLKANDAIQATTQDIMDQAEDLRAEADRKRRIQAGVEERLAALEDGIREEVEAEADGKKKPAKK